jgi:transcriptional regulator with XRE-family HTH domain
MRIEMGARLREERERLGLSQSEFAALGGATKRTQIAWEKGEQVPNAEFLAHAAAQGVDVLFVVTGTRMPTLPAAPQSLDDDAQAMVEIYRRLPIDDRAAVRRIANSAAKPAVEPKKRARGGE